MTRETAEFAYMQISFLTNLLYMSGDIPKLIFFGISRFS